MSKNNEIKRTAIDDEYETGLAPLCCYCGAKIAKSEVIWGSSAGAWHPSCAPVICGLDGKILKRVS